MKEEGRGSRAPITESFFRLPCEDRREALRLAASGEEIGAAQIVDGQQRTLEVVPPDQRRDVAGSLPDVSREQPQRRQAIVVVERAAILVAHAMRLQRAMVAIE